METNNIKNAENHFNESEYSKIDFGSNPSLFSRKELIDFAEEYHQYQSKQKDERIRYLEIAISSLIGLEAWISDLEMKRHFNKVTQTALNNKQK